VFTRLQGGDPTLHGGGSAGLKTGITGAA
jgi:hypothetical protein